MEIQWQPGIFFAGVRLGKKGGSGVSPAPFGDFCAYKSHPGSGAGEAPPRRTGVRGREGHAEENQGPGRGGPGATPRSGCLRTQHKVKTKKRGSEDPSYVKLPAAGQGGKIPPSAAAGKQ